MGKRINKEKIARTDIRLTAEEMNILFNEPAELFKLYIYLSLRRDFKTKIAGRATHINDTAFKEGMDYVQRPGRKAWRPSTTHITRWLDQLEGLGLIKQLGNYVFELPLAYTDESVKEISHQGVTNSVTTGVTNQEIEKPSINIDIKPSIENEVSPTVSPQVSKRLYVPPVLGLDKIGSDQRKDFFELLSQRKFPLAYLSDPRTNAMLEAWAFGNVTQEEASQAMQHADAQAATRQQRVSRPWYYQDIPFQFRAKTEQAKQQTQEIKDNASNTRATRQPFTKPDDKRAEAYQRLAKWREECEKEEQAECEGD